MSHSVLLVDGAGTLAARVAPVLTGALEPAGPAVSPEGALEAVRARAPDVLLVAVDGATPAITRLIERVMADLPRPIVLLVESAAARQVAFGLLEAGALEVLEWPARLDEAAATALRRQLVLLAGVTVVRHPRGRKRRTSTGFAAVTPAFPVVAIAASLGGPRALVEVLGDLPPDFPAPVVVVQHISPGFSDDLARWLAAETGHRVHEAREGQRLVKGEVFVSPAHLHLLVQPSGALRLDDGAPVGGFRPSCDVLLRSVAHAFGRRAVGVVLTGMGRDGAAGLKAIREQGGHTLAQDEATSVVFGMPGEAVALGAAEKVLPLEAIGAQLVEWVT